MGKEFYEIMLIINELGRESYKGDLKISVKKEKNKN